MLLCCHVSNPFPLLISTIYGLRHLLHLTSSCIHAWHILCNVLSTSFTTQKLFNQLISIPFLTWYVMVLLLMLECRWPYASALFPPDLMLDKGFSCNLDNVPQLCLVVFRYFSALLVDFHQPVFDVILKDCFLHCVFYLWLPCWRYG